MIACVWLHLLIMSEVCIWRTGWKWGSCQMVAMPHLLRDGSVQDAAQTGCLLPPPLHRYPPSWKTSSLVYLPPHEALYLNSSSSFINHRPPRETSPTAKHSLLVWNKPENQSASLLSCSLLFSPLPTPFATHWNPVPALYASSPFCPTQTYFIKTAAIKLTLFKGLWVLVPERNLSWMGRGLTRRPGCIKHDPQGTKPIPWLWASSAPQFITAVMIRIWSGGIPIEGQTPHEL